MCLMNKSNIVLVFAGADTSKRAEENVGITIQLNTAVSCPGPLTSQGVGHTDVYHPKTDWWGMWNCSCQGGDVATLKQSQNQERINRRSQWTRRRLGRPQAIPDPKHFDPACFAAFTKETRSARSFVVHKWVIRWDTVIANPLATFTTTQCHL